MEERLMKMMVEGGCPFAQRSHMKVKQVGPGGRVSMVLEDDESNLNAFGLVHAGAMCGLVETTAGMAVFNFVDPMEFLVLNTVLDIRFVAMPRGELTAGAMVVEQEMTPLVEEARQTGRADKTVDCKVFDTNGKMVASAQATFRLLPTPEDIKARFAKMMA